LIQIGDRLFEHRAMRRRAGVLQVGERTRPCQRKRGAFGATCAFLGGDGGGFRAPLRRGFLLRFN